MDVTIKPRALEQLARLNISAPRALRIDARLEGGGCGCNVQYRMVVDEGGPTDSTATTEMGFNVIANQETVSWLGERVSINYLPNVGYTLSNDEQTLMYGLKVQAE